MSVMAARPAKLVDIEDGKQLRRTFGTFATGVTVVTVGGDNCRGMTANSFTAVSLDPPLVLICVGREAVMHRSLSHTETFAVSVLSEGQEAVSRHFADHSRPAGRGQFEAVDWLSGPATGTPLIAGALAHVECVKERLYDGGDHTIFVGRVLSAGRTAAVDAPLVFQGGQFRRLAARGLEGGA
ncbi:FMN reductase (NADH) NtaB [Streptomyces sp. YIM 130001]|uniref:flavin reductase family protein n=1 Tax=Streptomyces sp. YIM 130001 TaxID=2259644 RepID=UPI000E652371|nr:flavin reductase family protein [Streptomyces sp. YIM 130001]RII06878.1 FMN reductase (NADH) NtaB [Streptomyces sp. YIM 130001]